MVLCQIHLLASEKHGKLETILKFQKIKTGTISEINYVVGKKYKIVS